jgi:predicted RNA-binding Zn-ribbon protein involved in translation (DUF1610 family)
MARRLTQAKKLKAGSEADRDVLYELFRAAALQLACPGCGKKGLLIEETGEIDADWPGPVPCSSCGGAIGQERLEALPGVSLCAECQAKDERGEASGPVDYCPRCGAAMEMRLARSGGLTRYVMACTGNPPCRRR